ncbi:DegT/DnrJ/EryC1/StrS family aminotransferase [Amycolatopsis pithecellobii]|uniref:DegT/DnrJ/EryC1/StrS family aminotransferase n=1 Tax=Amycolatopsis pithecellobii TaxID=664692 RepID=A0A6N7YT64_9PSEU|nr:DegT/DnrJ/EryC1/StrS family aminotransferase [Amycolatopsis pithecellobii]MTD55138.1 DegT/DnrJ/EryC1/StrS family aminotransferase [Amycolatopsis pithecellobii]
MTAGTRTRTVPFARCHIVAEAHEAVERVLASGWLTTGPQTMAFEDEFAGRLAAREAVAVSSCTAAIELALRALRLPPGAPVFTPTLTFCGAVHAIVHSGLQPVLLDTDERTLTVDPATVAAAAGQVRPQAMIVQHMAGYPVGVAALADAAGLPAGRVVEDAAHGLGAMIGGRAVGADSAAACFSFYATKNLPIGEGGAITTTDAGLAGVLREMRQHGMSRDAWRRYGPGASWRYDVAVDGIKANFTDLQAAIGRAQLPHLPAWQRRRAEVAARYDRALATVPGVVLPPRPAGGGHAWHLYPVRITAPYPLSRDALAAALSSRGVGTSVHFIPVHHFSYFRALLGAQMCRQLPVADRVARQLLSLPMHPGLTDSDIDYVCDQIADLARTGGDPCA